MAEVEDPDDFDDDENGGDPGSALPQDLQHVPLEYNRIPAADMVRRSEEFFAFMNTRRTVRFFSPDPVPAEVIRNVVRTAGTAPSGAHTEPWTYVVVSDPDIKERVRVIVEEEEQVNYAKRMGAYTCCLAFVWMFKALFRGTLPIVSFY